MIPTRFRLVTGLLIIGLVFTGCDKPAAPAETTPAASEAAPATAAISATTDPVVSSTLGAVPNVHASGSFFFAGQPAPADFAALKDAGVGAVINLRPDAEMGGFDEAAAAGSAGMQYTSIPWNGPGQLTDDIFDRTREVLLDVDGPALLHCASANRVGAVWIPFRVLDQGVDIEQAVSEARTIGMRTDEYEQIARDYVARNRK